MTALNRRARQLNRAAKSSALSNGVKPRILFAINSLAGGGAERVFTSLLASSAHRRRDYDFLVALLDEDPPAYTLPSWLSVHRLDCRQRLVPSLKRLRALVASQRPDLTVSFLTRANVAAALAMSLERRPFIISERVNTTAQLAPGRIPQLSRAIVRLTYPRAARVIAVSQGVASDLKSDYGVPAGRITVINNPVDAPAVEAMARDEPPFPVSSDDIIAMGRLCPQKNFPLAIRSFARSGWSGRLIILGDGPLASELRSLGDQLGLGERLVLPGFVKNPYAVISRAGLFMLTSDYEGFCNSLLEAMALGTAVVATDCPYSPSEILCVSDAPGSGQVVKGAGGLLMPTGDEAALASAIQSLRDPADRAALGAAGRNRVQAFDSGRIFEQYWQVIDEVAFGQSSLSITPAAPMSELSHLADKC